jgi:dihydroneopterin aldolase
MLKVNINDLTFNCIIGILSSERENEQKVIIDISFEYFYDDEKSNFIDYSEVANLVQQIMIDKKFKLIEDAILYIRKEIKLKYNIKNLRVKITKPDILSNCVVSVEE